ncbi:MAG: LysM peptidoglycan-binding domain-containing protein [Thermincola sp.]|jgi:spore germination protein|nr:LysM peptidoglycan-binding domain-containing protein [Thermincola sp.]MDT3702779.1 LysM peptidoglycan-binding domain-containing protein [Thermincola sp.]
MQIYVVRPGDTLLQISRRFGVDIQSIVIINGLQQIPYLITGQALVIPTTETSYIVRAGDTLDAISRRFSVTVGEIVILNNIDNPNLIYPGMVLRIPEPVKNYGVVEVNGYLEPTSQAADPAIVTEVGQFLTYLSPFGYHINDDGSLNAPVDGPALAAARSFRVAPLMVLTNFRNGTFDSALVHGILANNQVQQILIDNVLATMRAKGYYGLNIDFERIPPEDRQLYNSFLRKVVAALRPLNYSVSTALAPKYTDDPTGVWHGAHDYKAHGEIVDFVVLMTYEWGWSGGPPRAVAPLNEVRRVIDYAVTVIPRAKIMMGVPLYGYDWKLPFVPGGEWAVRVSPQQALSIAARYGANVQFDTVAQSPHFNYTDETGTAHVVWFEDARSVQAKYLLVNEYGLRGISYWVLGLPFPENWAVLDNMFQIAKVAVYPHTTPHSSLPAYTLIDSK